MRYVFLVLSIILLLLSCSDVETVFSPAEDNPILSLSIPKDFPSLNAAFEQNKPTQFGVALGKQLFQEKMFSTNNSISCASCHNQSHAFADNNAIGIGVYERQGLRNVPPIQNLAFMKFYNWDGSKLALENQALVPIITHEEMNSSMSEVIAKLTHSPAYKPLFIKAFGNDEITAEKIFKSLAQYQYTLISSNSKYDRVKRNEGESFTESEEIGYQLFQQKCATCHSTELFTDQSFRNIGFPTNPSTEEAGRARVTGNKEDLMRFRVPSLRNVEFTAPYGSFGQFATLMDVLDYFDNGVLAADNLDPILKENGNKIPLTQQEKIAIISFLKTLSDPQFIGQE